MPYPRSNERCSLSSIARSSISDDIAGRCDFLIGSSRSRNTCCVHEKKARQREKQGEEGGRERERDRGNKRKNSREQKGNPPSRLSDLQFRVISSKNEAEKLRGENRRCTFARVLLVTICNTMDYMYDHHELISVASLPEYRER